MSQPATISNDPPRSYPQLIAAYGFLPNLFRVQSAIPHAIEAEQRLIDTVVVREGGLSRDQKDAILNGVATVRGSDYCRALFGHSVSAVPDRNSALFDFSLKLAKHGPWVSGRDVLTLKNSGFDERAILEAIVTTAVGLMLCTLADGLQPRPDAGVGSLAPGELLDVPEPPDWPKASGARLGMPANLVPDAPAFAVLRDQFGFVPSLYRLQSAGPELLDAEVGLLESVLFLDVGLNRVQKECLLLAISAANLNTYCATLHSQVLSILGFSLEESDRIVGLELGHRVLRIAFPLGRSGLYFIPVLTLAALCLVQRIDRRAVEWTMLLASGVYLPQVYQRLGINQGYIRVAGVHLAAVRPHFEDARA
jgi:alkylhydroperoxidase family enzyme